MIKVLELYFITVTFMIACRFKDGPLSGDQKAHFVKLQTKISDLERKIKDFELSLPSQAG